MGNRAGEPRQMVRGASWIGAGRGAHVAWRKPVNQDYYENEHLSANGPTSTILGQVWAVLGYSIMKAFTLGCGNTANSVPILIFSMSF